MLDMDLVKKTLLIGLGIAAVGKDKIESLANMLVEKGNLSETEGQKLVDEITKKAEDAKNDLNEKVENMVSKALKKMNVVTKDDLASLSKQIKELEKTLKEKAD